MRKGLLIGALAGCALMDLSSSVALAADNWNGTWKLDLAKSKYAPPASAPKSQTLKFEASPAGTKLTADGVDADGKPIHASWTSKMDGKAVLFRGNPNAETASPKKVDDNNYHNIWRKAGRLTGASAVVVSADGKTLTVTQFVVIRDPFPATGENAKGEAVNITAVYERQ